MGAFAIFPFAFKICKLFIQFPVKSKQSKIVNMKRKRDEGAISEKVWKKIQKDGWNTVSNKTHPLQVILSKIVEVGEDNVKLLIEFEEYLIYDDVRYYTMKWLQSFLKNKTENDQETFVLLTALKMTNDISSPNLLVKEPAATGKVINIMEHKKLFSSVWLEFLQKPLTSSLYKSALVSLHDKVMPFMSNPLHLSDFLTQSYSVGGVISLLALNGLFVLINKYNLEYPNFYGKLYALLTPEVLFVKFRARFFFLLDLFLTSTHLPSYFVAAFVKKLSRLSLCAPPDVLKSLVPLILNLITRHPNCKTLLHSTSATSLASDPFIDTETNPANCRAMESSLWELKTLTHHYHHSVAKDARKSEEQLPIQETDISELLETSVDDLIDEETKKKVKRVATTYVAPEGLISKNDQCMNKMWRLAP